MLSRSDVHVDAREWIGILRSRDRVRKVEWIFESLCHCKSTRGTASLLQMKYRIMKKSTKKPKAIWFLNAAVSRKVVLQTGKSYYGQCWFLWLLEWTLRCFNVVEGNSTSTCIGASSLLNLLKPQSSKAYWTRTAHNTTRHYRVRFYTFVGQPLSKQLYIKTSFSYPITQITRFVIKINTARTQRYAENDASQRKAKYPPKSE